MTFAQIAELHAVQALGAKEPETSAASYRKGFDVIWQGRKIEVKSKEPPGRPVADSARYVNIHDSKRESDLFWFYLFETTPAALEVIEMATTEVFSARVSRKGTAITIRDVRRRGRTIWKAGKCTRGNA